MGRNIKCVWFNQIRNLERTIICQRQISALRSRRSSLTENNWHVAGSVPNPELTRLVYGCRKTAGNDSWTQLRIVFDRVRDLTTTFGRSGRTGRSERKTRLTLESPRSLPCMVASYCLHRRRTRHGSVYVRSFCCLISTALISVQKSATNHADGRTRDSSCRTHTLANSTRR